MTASRQRRFIYNNDGTNILGSVDAGELSPEKVRAFVDGVADTPVTSFFICSNSALMYYNSRHERGLGCLHPGQDPGHNPNLDPEKFARYGANMMSLREAGTDIVALCIDRAHELGLEGFVSMRMNDLHFTDPEVRHPMTQADFWLAHPEYYVGPHPGWNAAGALNYAHQAVRDHMLALIEEMCESFDLDGLELDFMRFPVFFPYQRGREYCQVMTDFVTAARQIARRTGERRGRPIMLTARLPADMETCLYKGFDPCAWVAGDLVDFITVTPWHSGDPLLALTSFRQALGGNDIPLYGANETGLYKPHERMTHGRFRALAAHLYDHGADGLYLFNFFFLSGDEVQQRGDAGVGANPSLLHELGALETLAGRNTTCTLGNADHGYEVVAASHLPLTMTPGAMVALPVGLPSWLATSRPPRAWLVLRLDKDAKPAISFNKRPVDLATDLAMAGKFGLDANLPEAATLLVGELPVAALRPGANGLTVDGGDGRLRRVEVVLDFGPVAEFGYF